LTGETLVLPLDDGPIPAILENMVRRSLVMGLGLVAGAGVAMMAQLSGWNGNPEASVASTRPTAVPKAMKEKITKTDTEWRQLLTPEQYRVTRQCGTEPPFTGRYWNHKEKGVYQCVGCGLPLFDSAKADFEQLCIFQAGLELAGRTVGGGEHEEKMFDLVVAFISELAAGSDPWGVFLTLEVLLLGESGLMPEMKLCGRCKKELSSEEKP